jgi:hypothetical protein
MKTIFKSIYFTLILTALSIVSCQEDISLKPLTFVETNTANSKAQLLAQLAGVYNVIETEQGGGLGLYSHALWGYLTANTDESFRTDAVTGTTTQVLTESYRAAASDASYYAFWKQLYVGIERANVLLDVVDQPKDISETQRNDIRGQAKFLRAYYFYLLVSNFGDVPLKTTLSSQLGIDFNIPRTPAKEVYNFIIKEMTEAEALVDTISDNGNSVLVSKTAVEGMLARVCLTMAGNPINDESKYADALAWAQKVINSGQHDLNYTTVAAPQFVGLPIAENSPAYSKVFINNMQNIVFSGAGNNEQIWDAAFLSKSNISGTYANTGFPATQQLGALMGIPATGTVSAIVGQAAGTYRVFPTLYKRYQEGDLRRDWAIGTYRYTTTSATAVPANTPQRSSLSTVNLVIKGTGTNPGTGATAVATVNPLTAKLASVVLTNGGSGYTSASSSSNAITATTVSGSGATFILTLGTGADAGKIATIAINNAGAGYPTVYDRPVGKWRREYEINVPSNRSTTITSCNFPIIRYADVLLMAAEADLKVNGGTPSPTAVGYYNKVRRRAFGYTDSSSSIPDGVEVATFSLEDLMDERSRELCFEGQRRNDLLRWNKMGTAYTNLINDNATVPATYNAAVNVAANNFLSNPVKFSKFPIPQLEFNYNFELTQNVGW